MSMSDYFIPTLYTLPVEILYHILGYLDTYTILCSFRYTCQKFRTIVNNYDRYVINFESICKSNFDQICYLIDPNRVRSLTLVENGQTMDQIKLFLSYFHLQQFNRLYSLSLFIREEETIKHLAERFHIPSLQIFSLQIERFDDRRKTTTARIISTILAQSNLNKLKLYIQDGRFEKIIWPTQYSIRYLEINNSIAIEQLHSVLQCSPYLQTIITNSFFLLNPNQSISITFDQLTSLTMNNMNMQINDLQFFLSMTPSLIYLKLIGTGNFFDGYQWENFIQLHLPYLNQFEFYFTEIHNVQKNEQDIDIIVNKFQTPFWLEHKKWFIICELDIDTLKCVTLYSIPICISILSYEPRKTSISTYPQCNNEQISIMNNVNTLKLDFTKVIPLDINRQDKKIHSPRFHKVNRLELQFGIIRVFGWIEFVSNLIDLKTIVYIKVSSASIRQPNSYMIFDMIKLLQQTSNLSSIDICFDFLSRKSCLTAADIFSLVPSHVQHLAVAIKDLNEIITVLEQRPELSSARFIFDYTPAYHAVTTWLQDNRTNSIYQIDSFSVCVWLGKKKNNNQLKEINIGHKRMKFTDE